MTITNTVGASDFDTMFSIRVLCVLPTEIAYMMCRSALELQAKMKAQSRKKPSRRRSSNSSLVSNTEDLNKLDVYLLGFKSERHTFSVLLQDGETRLYGHTLRYLPCHRNSKARADTGRRGVRAIVILTRATGGDQFYTALLR